MTPTSDRALEIGCVWTTTLMPQTTAIAAKSKKQNRVFHSYFEVRATIRAVTKRLTIATGNRTVQAKFIN